MQSNISLQDFLIQQWVFVTHSFDSQILKEEELACGGSSKQSNVHLQEPEGFNEMLCFRPAV